MLVLRCRVICGDSFRGERKCLMRGEIRYIQIQMQIHMAQELKNTQCYNATRIG